MSTRRSSPLVVILFLALALVALLTLGALTVRRDFLSRGIPADLPKQMDQAGVMLGVNVNLEQYDEEELTATLAEIRDTGFVAVKQPFFFSDDFDWDTSDRIIEAITASELLLVPLLDGDPADHFVPPADPGVYAQWAGSFARRYGEQVDHYIIWDEPNLYDHWGKRPVNPAEYAALLAASASAIRAIDPGAIIVSAPLAPTTELGPKNLADPLYLQQLYEAGASDAFDVIAGKPYGFDSGPYDRTVNSDTLNLSRIILLHEVAERNGDGQKAVWAGNWGWNSLPDSWRGAPSIWGQVDEGTQAAWTVAALSRGRQEWPWMGLMFLENWEPDVSEDDPHWGFSVAGRETAKALKAFAQPDATAYPGFHPAQATDRAQSYTGDWRFSPDYGVDIGESGDSVSFRFWGTEVALQVRRAAYHARFYATVDGEPANALPHDGRGASLVLNSPDPAEDYIATEIVARNLSPGEHTLNLVAHRGSDQWALSGFAVGNRPPDGDYPLYAAALILAALFSVVIAVRFARIADWGEFGRRVSARLSKLEWRSQLALTALSALVVAAAGWLTWGEQAAGIYRRLGDGGQMALTAAVASAFYVAPSFILYVFALGALFLLIYLRPAWGLALVSFSLPFYIKPKPMLGYRFSPVEIFLVVTLAAVFLRAVTSRLSSNSAGDKVIYPTVRLIPADLAVLSFAAVASLSLFFTDRLDVATNEWRVVVIEPVVFYLLLRWMPLNRREVWKILDAFILGGLAVSLIGLWQFAAGQNLITSEGGLMRLRSVYGSPNNVALYLGRMLPILVAMVVMGRGRRRVAYAMALTLIGLAFLLSYSKGALFLGLPLSMFVVLVLWRRSIGGRLWPWIVGAASLGGLALLAAFQIPQLAGRLDPQGATGFFRLNLWRSSLNMFRDHPIIGVGLDNFLYQYRGRYILDAAWQEPNLSHPHNLVLDFATRLGLLGLLVGGWLFWSFFQVARKLPSRVDTEWKPIAVGILGSLAYMLAHGLVDHSLFLVDLAYAFVLLLGMAIWLAQEQATAG